MVQRFKIEDLVYQDAAGVIFRAFDAETQQTVALRRFFPHGPDGEGLSAEEQIAYGIALDRLNGLNHPALRHTVCGGCDPVDGMPFIATEWIDGMSLSLLLESSPLNADEAADLLGKALDVCLLLTEVMAEEGIWVETELRAIIVGTAESGRGATFWISPFAWLGGNNRERGLEPIIVLCEEILGWKGKVINDHDAKGLGGWLRWLDGAARTSSLREAREALAASLGVEPSVPATRPIRQAVAAPPAKKKKSSRLPMWTLVSCLLFAIVGGAWALMRRSEQLPVPQANTTEMMDFASFTRESTPDEMRVTAASVEAEPGQPANHIASTGGIFTPMDRELLVANKDVEVTLEGVLSQLSSSPDRSLLYLVFAENSSNTAPRGQIRVKDAPNDLSESALKSLINQKIRMQGHVTVSKGRPDIVINNRAAIQVVE